MFNKLILIDRNRLDEECSEVTGYFDYWMSQETNSETEKENYSAGLKRDLRRMQAEEINREYGLSVSRVTEGVIEDLLKSDPKYQDLCERHADAKSQRRSYSTKVEMLKVLAQLHGQGYFSKIESSLPAVEIMAESIKKKITESIKKRSGERKRPPRPSRPKR